MVTESAEPANNSEIPEIPQAIIDAASTGRLIILWVLGFQQACRRTIWSRAAENALEEIVEKRLIPFAEAEQLKNEHPKKKLSIAMDISQDKGSMLDFSPVFFPSRSIGRAGL